MNNNNNITFKEFKSWLTELVLSKEGALPDFEDWKQIKIMINKVDEPTLNSGTYTISESYPTTYRYSVDEFNVECDLLPPSFATGDEYFSVWYNDDSIDTNNRASNEVSSVLKQMDLFSGLNTRKSKKQLLIEETFRLTLERLKRKTNRR